MWRGKRNEKLRFDTMQCNAAGGGRQGRECRGGKDRQSKAGKDWEKQGSTKQEKTRKTRQSKAGKDGKLNRSADDMKH